jgi:hypothetical protein
MRDEFYIGYAAVPPGVARTTRRTVLALLSCAVAACAVLVFAQQPFLRATFEYGQTREFQGLLENAPYPVLLVRRPGSRDEYSRYPLVGRGKNGAATAGLEGREVSLFGSLIYRDGHTMIEVESITPRPDQGRVTTSLAGPFTPAVLSGEIVDSKCYLGVMNPGRSKVHRDCAARCIRGGIPPMLVTADAAYVLSGAEVTDFVGESVIVEGEVAQRGDSFLLRAKKIKRRE